MSDRAPLGASRLASVIGVALLAACTSPTDQSAAVHVRLALPELYAGDTVQLRALLTDANGNVLPATDNVRFTVEPADAAVITGDNRLIALAPDTLTIITSAVEYSSTLRTTAVVRGGIRIDSVAPAGGIVRVGEVLAIYGIGLEGGVAQVGNRVILNSTYERGIPTSANGPGVLSFTMPPLNQAAESLNVIGAHGTATYAAGVTLRPYDIYEPNDTAPVALPFQTDGLGNFSQPALVLENGSAPPVDWYYFDNPVRQDVTISAGPSLITPLSSPVDLLVTDDAAYVNGEVRPTGSWSVDFATPSCALPSELPAEDQAGGFSRTIALRGLAPGRYHVIVYAEEPRISLRGYQMSIRAGYDTLVTPDDAESNDACGLATRVNPPLVGRELSIQSPTDRDWFRVTLTNAATLVARAAAPSPSAGMAMQGFLPGAATPFVAFDSTGSVSLPAGTYYLLITATQPTPYTLDLTTSAP